MKDLFWQLVLYSFLGFALEVAFARATGAKKRDRKCMLLLPLCPVYGLGAAAILHLPALFSDRPLKLFLWGALAATAVEYLVDFLYEKLLRVRFWDCSRLSGNVNGRVCLPFSLAWGLLALGLKNWLHPRLAPLLEAIPWGWTLLTAAAVALDAVLTVHILRDTGSTDSLRWYLNILPDRFGRKNAARRYR
ncbi:MAG: putative ABC transporter permease [Oscillospiraceae bacterium]|nr:putative ABC transporter permease [Oscillospiraceae bacterium]